jgi:hypothetical protein
VNHGACQPPSPVLGYRFSGGLLQRLIGEQPVRWVSELDRRLSPQQRGLHQHGGPFTETVTRRGDLGNQRRAGEPELVDLAQISGARVRPQVGDVVETEC